MLTNFELKKPKFVIISAKLENYDVKKWTFWRKKWTFFEKIVRDVRAPSRRLHDQGPAGSDRRDRPEFQPVAAGQVPHLPSAQQRRSQVHAPHRQHQLRKYCTIFQLLYSLKNSDHFFDYSFKVYSSVRLYYWKQNFDNKNWRFSPILV